MYKYKGYSKMWLMALLLVVFIAGCGGSDNGLDGGGSAPDITAPTISSTNHANAATDVDTNASITATFSEEMDPATITPATFTVTEPGLTPVTGTVTYAGTTAIFTLESNLAPNTTYTATITTGVKDPAGNALASAHAWSFTTGATADTTAPTVSSTNPENTATGVAIGGNIAATFSEAMNPLTVTTATFTLKQGTTPVPGTVVFVGTTATFNPTSNLAVSTPYTAEITTGVTDLAGNALATTKTWSFTTGTTADTTAPTVSSTNPANAATGVAIGGNIAATFSEAMNPLTVTNTTFTLKQGTTPVPGTVVFVGTIATFNPTSNLAVSTPYTATITTGVKDLAGNALAATKTWSFTTSTTADTTAPTVSSTNPANLVTGIAINANITANFSEAMNPATVTTANFTLKQGTTPVPGAVTPTSTTTATFNPSSDLTALTTYTATVTTGITDLAGNALASDKSWSFTTGKTADNSAPKVDSTNPANGATGVDVNRQITATFSELMNTSTLTTATFTLTQETPLGAPILGSELASFAVLGASTVTNTGATTLTGNLGVSPGSAITGKETITVNGTNAATIGNPSVHEADAFAILAQSQLVDAKTTLGLMGPGTTLGVDLAGLTLFPGVYTVPAGVSNLTGILTLDGKGDANAFWVFQMPSTLITSPGSVVNVINTGSGAGVGLYWNVGSSATLDTTTSFQGNILALANITLNTGATIRCGRALANVEAVNMDNNTLSPGCAGTGKGGGNVPVPGDVDYSTTATSIFTPASPLAANTTFTARISADAKDRAGNALAAPFTWSFTTGDK